MKNILAISLLLFILPSLSAQTLQFDWQQCLGGSNSDCGYAILPTWNGYILYAGTSSNDGQVTFNHGKSDFWLVRTDSFGAILWSRTYGGSNIDGTCTLKKCSDGGYGMFGETYSNDGDVSGNHGDGDYWLVKVDSLGDILWQQCFGGTAKEVTNDMTATPDSGFLLTGGALSTDGNITWNHGFYDCWMVKVDHNGNLQWEKSIGGTEADLGISVKTTGDGGYIVAASTHSNDGDVQCNVHGDEDWEAWIVKLDAAGNIKWQKCYGGTKGDGPNDILQTSDGGYIFAGTTNSNDGDVSGNHGQNDIWVVKIDSVGTLQWQRCYGGSLDDIAVFIRETMNGTFIVGGFTYSNDGDVTGNHSDPGFSDAWLLRISPTGGILWKQCIGGDQYEAFEDMVEFPGGKITLLGGSTTGDHTGDVQCDHHSPSWYDVWMVGVTDTTVVGMEEKPLETIQVRVYPNPAGDRINFSLTGSTCFCETRITLVNIYGQIINEIILPAGQQDVSFPIGYIPAGFYTYLLSNRQVTKIEKIIITK